MPHKLANCESIILIKSRTKYIFNSFQFIFLRDSTDCTCTTTNRYKTHLLFDETNDPKHRKAAKAYFQPAAGGKNFGPGPVSEHAVSELAPPSR